jgi:hypothetical protein
MYSSAAPLRAAKRHEPVNFVAYVWIMSDAHARSKIENQNFQKSKNRKFENRKTAKLENRNRKNLKSLKRRNETNFPNSAAAIAEQKSARVPRGRRPFQSRAL